MNPNVAPRSVRGFTLLDTLIAVVVLATGILALTLLQVSMLRTAADARERSIAMSLGQNILEERRAGGAQTQALYQSLDKIGTWSGTDCDYANSVQVPGSTTLQTEFRYCVNVQRYRSSGGSFAAVPVTGTGAPTYSGVTPEFKHVTIHIGWRKQDGSWGDLRIGDALSGIPLNNTNDLENRPITESSTSPPAQVKYDLTSLTQNTNFIPIAVGDGSGNNVAATNPTPKVMGAGIAETSFQVFTYSAASGYANVQREVDTKVLGCSCRSRNAPSLATPEEATTTEFFLTRPLRASYWNGVRYTDPPGATYAVTDLIGEENPAKTEEQSELCDVCCRDHHDPASVDFAGDAGEADDIPKYDPYRTNHTHYINPLADDTSDRVTAAGQIYDEVCRVVRVDGVYRVTQDPEFDHYAFIPTDNNALDYTVENATQGYRDFVQEYIDDRILPLSGYDWATNRAVTASLEAAHGLNSQAGSNIQLNLNDTRYLQNRALLMDPLSYGAKSWIQDCIDQTGTNAPSDIACVLRHLSFASVNLTELTAWTVVPQTAVSQLPFAVSSKNFKSPDLTPIGAPLAGRVQDSSGAVQNSIADAVGTINRSIATLADHALHYFQNPVKSMTDRQPFQFVGGNTASVKFTVRVNNLSTFDSRTGNAPWVGWSSPSQSTPKNCTQVGTTTEFLCDLRTTTNVTNIVLHMRNYYGKLNPVNNGAQCDPPSGKANKLDLPKCAINHAISISPAVTFSSPIRVQGAAGLPKNDESTFQLGTVADGATYAIGFTADSSVTATYACDAVTFQPIPSFTADDCQLATN